MAERSQALAEAIAKALDAYGVELPEVEPQEDKTVVNGIAICDECGEPIECACTADNGTEIRFPIVHSHDIDRANASMRRETLKAECFKGFEDYAGAEFAECDTPLKSIFTQWCAEFAKYGKGDGKGFIIYGDMGVGKTYLAACVCNQLIKDGWRCTFTTIRSVLDDKKSLIPKLEKSDLVVIDDFGAERTTSFGLETTYDVINRLYSKRIPMFITTNMNKSQLASPPVELARALDRIKERCGAIEYEGANRRQGVIV